MLGVRVKYGACAAYTLVKLRGFVKSGAIKHISTWFNILFYIKYSVYI